MQNGSNDVARNVLAFGLGVVAGGVAALLLAPASGEETRKKIGDMATKVGQQAKQTLDTTKQIVGNQKERLNVAIDAGRQAYAREASPGMTMGRPDGV